MQRSIHLGVIGRCSCGLLLAASLALGCLGCGSVGGSKDSGGVFSRGLKGPREAKLRQQVEKDSFPTAAQAGIASASG